MSLTPVKSSNIRALGYDDTTQALTVEFVSGAKHRYDGVEADAHAKLMAAESIGSHFHAHIRSAHKSTKLEEE